MSLTFLVVFSRPFCQTISGKIENASGERISLATIVLKDSAGAFAIRAFVLARNGFYSIHVKEGCRTLVIEASSTGYIKDGYSIDSLVQGRTYCHNFILQKDTAHWLPDIVVKARGRPFQISGDTVRYTVSAYKDGTERKIQDLLKKLPGILVDEKTGEVRYKGRSVETVKLDGEDLFSSNYTIGTKNIDVELVERVEAIENYSGNPLLKGIEGGGKVALNLLLKKKRNDYSGSVDASLGLLDKKGLAVDAGTDLLAIAKKHKAFATFSFNDVGINNTPADYFAYRPVVERSQQPDVFARKYIPDLYFEPVLDPRRSHTNHLLFASYNSVVTFSKRWSLRTNLFWLKDRIRLFQNQVSENRLDGQIFMTSDNDSVRKRPIQYHGETALTCRLSPASLLELTIRSVDEDIHTGSGLLQNETASYRTYLKTRDVFWKQSALFTHRISDRTALQVLLAHSLNDLPQDFVLAPAIYLPSVFDMNSQHSHFKKRDMTVTAALLGNHHKGSYSVSMGTDLEDSRFHSNLSGLHDGNTTSIEGFNNRVAYRKFCAHITANGTIRLARWRLTPVVNWNYLKEGLRNMDSGERMEIARVFFEPSLSIGYRINTYSTLLITPGCKRTPFPEDYLIGHPVFISARTTRANEVALRFQKAAFLSMFFLIDDLYRQFQLSAGGSFSASKGGYFSDWTVRQNSTKVVYFFLPQGSKSLSGNLLIEKYLDFLQSTVRLKSDYSCLYYKNIVNNAGLRNNSIRILSSELFFKTAFDAKINMETALRYRIGRARTADEPPHTGRFLNDNMQLIVKPGNCFFFLASMDYYRPVLTGSRRHYFFWDASANLSAKKKNYTYRFAAKNLTNNKSFRQIETTDFSTTQLQTSLLPRYVMLGISRSF